MAITTYATLQTAIANWLHRDDLTDVIPDFITGAEALINYGGVNLPSLRTGDMETSATVTITNGAGTLPADFLEARRVIALTSPNTVLEAVSPEFGTYEFAGAGAGWARAYSISGTTLTTYPSSSSNVSVLYYAKVPALSVSNTTNWLLTKSPMVYLYGSLVQSAPFVGDDARAQVWGELYRNAVAGLRTSDIAGRFGRVGMRTRSPTP